MSLNIDDILGGISFSAPAPTKEEKQYNKPIALPFKDYSNKWKGIDGGQYDTQLLTEDLKGLILKRIPMPIPDFESYRSIPSYTYQAMNQRDLEVKLVLRFSGENLQVSAGATCILKGTNMVEGYLKPGESVHFCTCEPLDKKAKVFEPFNCDVVVFPSQSTTKEETLDGVSLLSRVIYGESTAIEYECFNTKPYEILVEVKPEGQITSKSSSLPFSALVRPGQRASIGTCSFLGDIRQSWRWETAPSSVMVPNTEKKSTKSEAKGVFLTKTQTPADLNLLELEIDNTLGVNIVVNIEIQPTPGTMLVLNGESNPIRKPVKMKSSTKVAEVRFKGDVAISWGWEEQK